MEHVKVGSKVLIDKQAREEAKFETAQMNAGREAEVIESPWDVELESDMVEVKVLYPCTYANCTWIERSLLSAP